MKYRQEYENEWVQPIASGYKMACCDCGLVHDMDFRIHEGRVQFRARRNKRSTAVKRRYINRERELQTLRARLVEMEAAFDALSSYAASKLG